jgi:hypothetical protein
MLNLIKTVWIPYGIANQIFTFPSFVITLSLTLLENQEYVSGDLKYGMFVHLVIWFA